jgi:hypothetical protein
MRKITAAAVGFAAVALVAAPIAAAAAVSAGVALVAAPSPHAAAAAPPPHGSITCWESTQVKSHGREVPFVTLDGTHSGRRELTCTLTPQYPRYLNHWTLRAPGGAFSTITIRG